jgi:hypothetical protein
VDPDDTVTISLIGRSYPEPFGRSAAMPIACTRTRGLWTLVLDDLGTRDRDTAIQHGADAKVVFV